MLLIPQNLFNNKTIQLYGDILRVICAIFFAFIMVSNIQIGACTPNCIENTENNGISNNIQAPIIAPYDIPDNNQLGLVTVTFPANCFIIPMDNHQADVIKAFGLVHALLRNNTMVCRIIEPLPAPAQPNITIKTLTCPNGDNYSGGPILVHYIYQNSVNSLLGMYPTVTVDRTTEAVMSSKRAVVPAAIRFLEKDSIAP